MLVRTDDQAIGWNEKYIVFRTVLDLCFAAGMVKGRKKETKRRRRRELIDFIIALLRRVYLYIYIIYIIVFYRFVFRKLCAFSTSYIYRIHEVKAHRTILPTSRAYIAYNAKTTPRELCE